MPFHTAVGIILGAKGRGQNRWQRAESAGLEFGVWPFCSTGSVVQEEGLAGLVWFSHRIYRGQAVILDAAPGKRSNGLGLVDSEDVPDKPGDLVKDSWRGRVMSPEGYWEGTDEFSPDCWLSQSLCSILSTLEIPSVHRFKIAWKGIRSEI